MITSRQLRIAAGAGVSGAGNVAPVIATHVAHMTVPAMTPSHK